MSLPNGAGDCQIMNTEHAGLALKKQYKSSQETLEIGAGFLLPCSILQKRLMNVLDFRLGHVNAVKHYMFPDAKQEKQTCLKTEQVVLVGKP